jgi:multiple sugar transport system ATP-binding protein
MRAELKRLHNQLEATTIYVTHDQLEAIALADYIAVMNFGELQQFGTPEDLYENPANHFVAGFLGTPPMNFIEGHFERSDGDLWFRNEHFNLCLDKFTRAKLDAVESVENITLGVRPQDIHISKTGDENHNIKCRTFIWELQGEKNQAVLEIGRHHFIAEAEADFVSQTGEDVWIQVNLDHIHFFDSSTGKNILI